MKNTFIKTTAAFMTAGLMTMGAVVPAFAAETGSETQYSVQYIYYEYDENGYPVWNPDLCQEEVGQYQVMPGKFYIQKRTHHNNLSSQAASMTPAEQNYYYLIQVVDVYEKGGIWGFGTTRTALCKEAGSEDTYELSLTGAHLYDIPHMTGITASF